MKSWVTVAIAIMLGMSAMKLDPAFGWPIWTRLASAWQVSHPLFLGTLALVLFLVALPVEVRLGRAQLQASWTLPCVLQSWLVGRAWPELAAFSVMVTMLLFALGRGDRLQPRLWIPLGLVMALTLFQLHPPPLALLISAGVGAAIAWKPTSELIVVLGMAGGASLLLAWLA